MVERVTDGVWRLELGLVTPLRSSAYLVDEGAADAGADDAAGPTTLVDAGLFYNRPSLLTELDTAGYDATDVDRVLLTHYDLDHVGGLPSLHRRGFDGPVHIGTADADLLSGEWRPPLAHHKGAFHRIARRLFPVDGDLRPVADGDRLGTFDAHHTPGHNPGHTVYVNEPVGVAFLGDLVWSEGGELTPPFWLDSYDMHEVRSSIRRLADRRPVFEYACTGHGSVLPDGDDRLQRLAARL